MSEPFLYSFIAIAAISAISALAALFYPARAVHLRVLMLVFVGIAVGALLGDAFIHLIPEASASLGDYTALWVLAGMGIFFILEKFLHWHHHHEPHEVQDADCDDCAHHVRPFGFLIIFSDVLHNIIDGVIIAAGFLVSTEAGVATAIAVALHELPQEIGDFGVLLHAGFSRTKALIANVASSLSAFAGGALVFFIGSNVQSMVPIFSALAAGSFIYIAAADLVPELHRHSRAKESALQFLAVVVGVTMMWGLTFIEESTAAPAEGKEITQAMVSPSPQDPSVTQEPSVARTTENSRSYGAAVARIIDGDTIVVNTTGKENVHVRLIGIDAPETNAANGKSPECYANEATEVLRTLLPAGTMVHLETDSSQDTYDTYGRLLAYVFKDNGLPLGENINETMLVFGAAKEYTFKNRKYSYFSDFQRAETAAHDFSVGLWAMCP